MFSRSCWRLLRCPAWTQSHHVHGLPAKRSLTESGCLAPPTAGTGRQKVNEAYHGTRGESAAPIETVAGRERARAVSAPGGGSCRGRVAEGDERGRPSPDGRRSEYKVQGQWLCTRDSALLHSRFDVAHSRVVLPEGPKGRPVLRLNVEPTDCGWSAAHLHVIGDGIVTIRALIAGTPIAAPPSEHEVL